MGKGIAKIHQTYSFPRLIASTDSEDTIWLNDLLTTYPHCGLGIMNEEPSTLNYVESLEGDLMLVARDEFPNGVNFYIDNMGNLIVYTDDETYKNFSMDEMGNLIYTTP